MYGGYETDPCPYWRVKDLLMDPGVHIVDPKSYRDMVEPQQVTKDIDAFLLDAERLLPAEAREIEYIRRSLRPMLYSILN